MTQKRSAPSGSRGPQRRTVLASAAAALADTATKAANRAIAPVQVKTHLTEPQQTPGYYPPTRTGMRGSHPGCFESAHALRDGTLRIDEAKRVDEPYDLVVVGGGISGLSAAHFYRKAKPSARILILENHDDFGGHAKRNEIDVNGHLLLLNGGTMEIDSPRPYSAVATGLLDELGIRPAVLAKRDTVSPVFRAATRRRAVFFCRETFGEDRLVLLPGSDEEKASPEQWTRALTQAPLSTQAKRDIVRIETGSLDYLPGLSTSQKHDRLSRISYRDFLKDIVKVDPQVLDYYQTATHGEFGIGIDGEPALDCWGFGLPGFQGLGLDKTDTNRMGNTAAGYQSTGGSERFHFPDGNATIARALVRGLVPAVASPGSIEALVTAPFDYGALDSPAAPVRIRLNSVAVNVQRRPGGGVDVAYTQLGHFLMVSARHCVLAGYNMMIPYLVPELPEAQKDALHQLVKVPLVYVTVALTNWRAFAKLGIIGAACPGAYYSVFRLFPGPEIGAYHGPASPDAPIVLHMLRAPSLPGLPTERDQHRAGRAELLETSIDTFETHVRDQLQRVLGSSGFDAQNDIAAIIVNRWPHGYAYEYNPLYDAWDIPDSQRPHVIGRQRFGPITIANSDSGAAAYTDCAIDQAHRAVSELLSA